VWLTSDRLIANSENAPLWAGIWDRATGRSIAYLDHASETVMSRSGAKALVALDHGPTLLLDTANGRQLDEFPNDGECYELAMSPDERKILVGDVGGISQLWDVAHHSLIELVGHGDVLTVALSDERAATLDDDGLKLWDVTNGRLVALLAKEASQNSVVFDPSGRVLAAGTGPEVMLWNAADGGFMARMSGHTAAVSSLSFLGSDRLVSSSQDSTAKVWSLVDHRVVGSLEGHSSAVIKARASSDARWIATSTTDGTVRIWDGTSYQLLAVLRGHTNIVYAIAFSADGRTLASGGMDDLMNVWQLPLFQNDYESLRSLVDCRSPFVLEQGGFFVLPRIRQKCSN
jgi:WD40 repeat protein